MMIDDAIFELYKNVKQVEIKADGSIIACDIDKKCRETYIKNFPGTSIHTYICLWACETIDCIYLSTQVP